METRQHTSHPCSACEPAPRRPWWKDRVLWAFAMLAVVLGLGGFWPAAAEALRGYLAKAGWAVALGLLLGGVIERFIPKEYITLWLAGRHRRTIVASAGLGFLASSCSHGCLALSMELFRKGASIPAVMTFLLASPWASLSMTLLIVSLMGWKGLIIVVTALLVAAVTGFVFQKLECRGLLEPNPHTVPVAAGFSIWQDIKARLRRRSWGPRALAQDLKEILRGSWELGQMVLFWVVLGFTLSAVLGTAIPQGWWSRFLSPTPLGLLTTLGLATVCEVCSEGTAPLAVELYRKTGAMGNAFGFLMGGVVTDFTELSMVWTNVGKKAAGWLLLVTLPQVFLLGMLMNWLGG